MRTVTFSNPEVAKAVEERFVATWVNREPGFHSCDEKAERRIATDDYEAYATKNFCTFFTTPDLGVLHYASGHYFPPLFLGELASARELGDAVLDSKGALRPDWANRYGSVHAVHSKEHNEKAAALRRMRPPKGTPEETQHFIYRRDSYAEGLGHLKEVHRDLARKARERERLVPLKEVFHTYLHGNSFEETRKNQKDGRETGD